jgi:predicted protein tyrosine phosphatase
MPNGEGGYAGTRPKLGFSPKTPLKAAGIRIEPAPSLPRCSGAMPAAQAAAAPALLPPGVRARSQGLRVMPVKGLSPKAFQPQSGNGRRILGPVLVRVDEMRAAQGRKPAHRHQILDRRRNAVERPQGLAALPARLGGARRRHRSLAVDDAERVDLRLQRCEPRQQHLRGLDRRQRLLAELFGERYRRCKGEIPTAFHLPSSPRTRPGTLTIAAAPPKNHAQFAGRIDVASSAETQISPQAQSTLVSTGAAEGRSGVRAAATIPFRVTICGLDELGARGAEDFSHVLSILDPGWPEPAALRGFDVHRRLRLHFHDVIEPLPGSVAPQRWDVDLLLAFGRDLATAPGAAGDVHVLVHCHAGLSRSTAAAILLLAQRHRDHPADAVIAEVARLRPRAWPNLRILEFGDAALGRGGEIVAAARSQYRRVLEREPQLAEAMIGGGRGREVAAAMGRG